MKFKKVHNKDTKYNKHEDVQASRVFHGSQTLADTVIMMAKHQDVCKTCTLTSGQSI